MTSSLFMKAFSDSLQVIYKDGDDILLETKTKYGLLKLEDYNMRERAMYLLLDPLLQTLEKISLYERIPLHIYLETEKHGPWIKHCIEQYPYAQFYTGGKKMSVILKKVEPILYARHTKKTLNFKI